jgi:hypothetical protein
VSWPVTSVQNNLPSQYRKRAQEARDKAAAAADEDGRKLLLHDAQLWEQMAVSRRRPTRTASCAPLKGQTQLTKRRH